jgi:hypothetical protein
MLRQESFHFRINKGKIAYRLINKEAVILSLENGVYYSLNQSGTLIWQLIASGKNLEQIWEDLAKRFEASGTVIKKDANVLISELIKEGLIEKIKKE